MDRNSAIGLTLIAVLLIGYFYWFSPQPQPVTPNVTATRPSVSEKKDSVQAAPSVPDDG